MQYISTLSREILQEIFFLVSFGTATPIPGLLLVDCFEDLRHFK